MASVTTLLKRRKRVLGKIYDNLGFLIGSISSKGLKYEAYNLTTKVNGVTKTKHIPIEMLPLVRKMNGRHQKLKVLLKDLSEVNWLLVREGEELKNHGPL